MKIPEKYQKYQIFIWPVLAILSTTLILFLFIIPQITIIIDFNKSIDESKQRINALNKKADFLQQVDAASYKENIKNTLIIFPEEKAYPAAINQVEVLVNKAGFRITALSISSLGKSKEGFDNFQINLGISGDLSGLNTLIESVKRGPRIMSIGNIDVTGSQPGNYQVNLQINSYFQAQQTNLGSLDQPVSNLTEEEVALLTKFNETIQSLPNAVIPAAPQGGVKGKVNPFF